MLSERDKKLQVEKLIFDAIDELNITQSADERLEKALDTPLLGESGKLNSLGLVNLIVGVEERVESEAGVAITIADEKYHDQNRSPFSDVSTLVDYVSMLIDEATNGDAMPQQGSA